MQFQYRNRSRKHVLLQFSLILLSVPFILVGMALAFVYCGVAIGAKTYTNFMSGN